MVPGSSFSDLEMMKNPGAWGCGRMKNVMLRCCRLVVKDGSEVVYIEGGMTKRGEHTLSKPTSIVCFYSITKTFPSRRNSELK